jgi:hypothetical protein
MSQNYNQAQGTPSQVERITGTDEMGSMKIGAIVRNPDLPSISYTSDADHRLYKDAMTGINKLPQTAFRNDEERQNAAAALALEAKEHGLTKIDHVTFNKNGDKLIAVEGNMRDPAHNLAHVNFAEAVNKSSEHSIQQANQQNSHLIASQQLGQQIQEKHQQDDQQKQQREGPKPFSNM